MITIKSVCKSYITILFFLVVLATIILPNSIVFSKQIFYVQVLLYSLALVAFFKIKQKRNYLDVDVIFITFLTIPHFVIPFYTNSLELDIMFYRGYHSFFFIKGVMIALSGLLAYMLGSLKVENDNKKISQINDKWNYKNVNENLLICCVVICIAFFTLYGGYEFYKNQYMEGVGFDTGNSRIFQATSLLTVFSNVYCSLITIDKKGNNLNRFVYMATIFIFATSVALVGCRTLFVGLVLPYIMCFTYFKKPVNLLWTILGLMVGVALMYILQITRQGGNSFNTGFFYLFSDMIIPGNVFFESIGYVEKNGLNYGLSMMPPLIGCIPGLSSILGSWTTEGSAEIMTKYLSGAGDVAGLGTTIFADIYLSFGVIGVPLFMYLLGYYANKKWRNSFYGLVINTAFFSSCLFMCRAGYFLPMRLILWGLLFSKICNMKIKKF